MSYYGGEIKYSRVKIKILKCKVKTFWYYDLVGKIVPAIKAEFDDGHITYKDPNKAAYFTNEDIKESLNTINTEK